MEYQANNSFVDIFAGGALIELKTPNTKIHDIGKLQGLNNISAKRHIAFVMFPIDDSGDYQTHVNKIISELLNNDYVQKEIFVCGVIIILEPEERPQLSVSQRSLTDCMTSADKYL